MSDKDELDRILGAFPCDFKPEEYGSRICTYCGESAGELRHRIKSELQSYIAQHTKEAERLARINVMQQWEADLAYACGYTDDAPYFANQRAIVQKNLAELATPTSSPDGSELKRTFNRLEIIDHTATGTGRDYVKWIDSPFGVSESVQDDGRTLKIFLSAPQQSTGGGDE